MLHTPGPWTFGDEYGMDDGCVIQALVAKDYGIVGYVCGATDEKAALANAQVQKAAPELLAALVEIIDIETDDDGDRIIPPDFLDNARAAIASATIKR